MKFGVGMELMRKYSARSRSASVSNLAKRTWGSTSTPSASNTKTKLLHGSPRVYGFQVDRAMVRGNLPGRQAFAGRPRTGAGAIELMDFAQIQLQVKASRAASPQNATSHRARDHWMQRAVHGKFSTVRRTHFSTCGAERCSSRLGIRVCRWAASRASWVALASTPSGSLV